MKYGIEKCMEYDVKVTAVIGEEYSESKEKRFASLPLEQQAEMFEVQSFHL